MHRVRDGHRGRRRAGLNSRDIVRRGYDAVAARYAEWRVLGNPAPAFVADLDRRLPDGADVLEVGCGNGRPAAIVLARRHRYTGVDISREQLARARTAVPTATFVEADYTGLEIPRASLDAVIAILTLTHVPREEHAALVRRFAAWLRPGGYFLASFGVDDGPDAIEPDWLGAPMYFSHFDAKINRSLVVEAGLHLLRNEIHTMVEEGYGESPFLWILAQVPR